MFNDEKKAGEKRDRESEAELLAKLNAMSSDLLTKSVQINAQVAAMKVTMDTSISSLKTQVDGSVAKGIQEAKADVAKVGQDVADLKKTSGSKTDVAAVTTKVNAAVACAAKGMGMAVVGGKCVVVTEAVVTKCEATNVGSSRFNVKENKAEICLKGGPNADKSGYGYEVVALQLPKGTSETSPATGGQEIIDSNKSPKSGLWWIKPPGDSKAVQTYCDFNPGVYAGYCLASYGHVASRSCNSGNKNMPPLNSPNGHEWTPENRQRRRGVIALDKGATNMAKSAKKMIMAARSSGQVVAKGGIDAYSYVYEIDIAANAGMITFQNQGTKSYGCSQTEKTYRVRALKGEGNTAWRDKRSLGQSLGLSWTDSYPTGYGFSNQWRKCSRNWGDGPFFPSIHHGSNRGCSCCQDRKTWPGASHRSDPNYNHQGWYRIDSGKHSNTGAMSIWFK